MEEEVSLWPPVTIYLNLFNLINIEYIYLKSLKSKHKGYSVSFMQY
jgi:hypothetical protein